MLDCFARNTSSYLIVMILFAGDELTGPEELEIADIERKRLADGAHQGVIVTDSFTKHANAGNEKGALSCAQIVC